MKMLRLLAMILLLLAVPVAAQHADVVAAVKTELQAKGVDLSGACGAFAITKRVAWRLRMEQAGLLSKPSGNNCDAYAVDIVMYPDGRIFDILVDAGGGNGPAWNAGEAVEASRYRPAVDPGDTPTQPPPPPIVVVPPPVVDLAPLQADLARVEAKVDKLAAEEAAFHEEVRGVWKRLVHQLPIILPVVGALLAGTAIK